LTERAGESLAPTVASPASAWAMDAKIPDDGISVALSAGEVMLLLGRAMVKQPKSEAEIARDPGPFLCLLGCADDGGFDQIGPLFRVLARPNAVRACSLAEYAASFIPPLAFRAVLKHYGLEWLMAPPSLHGTGEAAR
jgi:hypothetical protein